eukprot:CAMPEP_0176300594 /NCGR_PEP_ID=MMETSP0121_2-20121125/60402_1 /TAXON_ID=160619 /ORGANISM="Kryptoperidinium foliaceum, Strain CCMP 1326" /LENGTH=40 /DNA_ID= /DNA_START= /DNA_END= /DNA_ORIENTATION=
MTANRARARPDSPHTSRHSRSAQHPFDFARPGSPEEIRSA